MFESPLMAKNYEDEFQELWKGIFGKGPKTAHPIILRNGMRMESYFCPEDHCSDAVVKELGHAQTSIHAMLFSFTDRRIANVLAIKNAEGKKVNVLMEKMQNRKYSQYDFLVAQGIGVKMDKNPSLMHHKVFIIDGKTVITGSFNPSENADTSNDENLIVIEDQLLAEQFLGEFESLYE